MIVTKKPESPTNGLLAQEEKEQTHVSHSFFRKVVVRPDEMGMRDWHENWPWPPKPQSTHSERPTRHAERGLQALHGVPTHKLVEGPRGFNKTTRI